MALVRVYCGLASADSADRPAQAGPTLTAAVVDDAGRLLDVRAIGDDPAGYAQLGALLLDRSSGPSGAAIAADSDDHVVSSLLNAAGRPLAIADDDSVDDYAERFADDESVEEMESSAAKRRAVGLARALQAGALSAMTLPVPRDLAGYKPVLAAHTALANGRHGAAVALREVLRELYPAALRAYLDPAEPVSLAVLDALPEPGMLTSTSTSTSTSARGRDTAVATDAIAAHLAADGVATEAAISDAVTSLRVAIAETPRRAPASKALTSAVAETIRQAVAAVRAYDSACEALVATLEARVTTPPPVAARRTVRRAAPETPDSGPLAPGPTRIGQESRPAQQPVPSGGRRSRPEPAPGSGGPVFPRPVAPPPVAPAPVAPPPTAPRPVAPAAMSAPLPPTPLAASAAPTSAPPGPHRAEPPTNRPVSAPPPSASDITPITPSTRGPVPPADAGEPFRATLTTAAINSARSERQRPTPINPRPKTNGEPRPSSDGFGATDLTLAVPAPRPEGAAPPGSRANWPLMNPAVDRSEPPGGGARERANPFGERPTGAPEPPVDAGPGESRGDLAESRGDLAESRGGPGKGRGGPGEGRVMPPWLADDLPPEPPTLRLVEPSLLGARPDDGPLGAGRGPAERSPERQFGERAPNEHLLDTALPTRDGGLPWRGGGLPEREAAQYDTPPVRLIEPGTERLGRSRRAAEAAPPSAPVSAEGDGDLLIFVATRSAWFTGQADPDLEWSSPAMDTGWRAAEQAARPAVGADTDAGLPKRVPQANLVPGSPLRDERPLRIVRDAARIAEHTTGYFRGWRRGQEIGGYAVGGRPGREAAGGWDFSRDHNERESDRDYEFRSAGYHS